jgi:hypothetical protein
VSCFLFNWLMGAWHWIRCYWFVASASFHGVNTATLAKFRQSA